MQPDQHTGQPQIVPLGLDGFLVRFSSQFSEAANRAALAFRESVEAADLAGIEETACSLGAVHVRFDPLALPHATLRDALESLAAQVGKGEAPAASSPRRLWRVPTLYGGTHGPQLEAAAAAAGIATEKAVEQLSSLRLRVMAIGFAPGFPYLGQLPETWDLPRHDNLQTRVPPGALCLAVRQMVLFPTASQTGWHHVGQTAFRGFRPDESAPFPLRPGDEMTFPSVSAADFARCEADPTGNGGATCEGLD